MRYIPNSTVDRKQMLEEIGIQAIEDFFAGIPEDLRLRNQLKIPTALTEPELLDYFQRLSTRNSKTQKAFLGAGVYHHYIPLIIDALISRSEFFTAYTPYQAEIAQGTLQAIFEFQTYITQLTGMDISNASLYDGSTGLAEAIFMAQRITKKNRFIIARTVHPEYRSVVETYTSRLGIVIKTVDFQEDGRVDLERIDEALNSQTAAVVTQSPNFFGTIEDTAAISALSHRYGALSIVNIAEALSLGILKPPGDGSPEERADIVVGEAQSLGVPMNFGGPHVGYIAARSSYLRQIPGRLVGLGKDQDGERAFVLTLATREQHIRREKATSNICTNQSLCALMATIYLATIGPNGLRELAKRNIQNTAYTAEQITKQTNHEVIFTGPRFNEFVLRIKGNATQLLANLKREGIVLGTPLSPFYSELENTRLLCVTEMQSKKDIDQLIEGLT